MQTGKELIEWIELKEKECIDLHYVLIDSLNYPEIDRHVRYLRGVVWNFEQKLNSCKEMLKDLEKIHG